MFNMTEILEIAEKIERNGVKFYELASQRFEDAETVELLKSFAEMESRHEDFFRDLRLKSAGIDAATSPYDPDHEGVKYLEAIADAQVFDINATPESVLADCKDKNDILDAALAAEKDSVVFYSGLRHFVKGPEQEKLLQKVIDEELSHVTRICQLKLEL